MSTLFNAEISKFKMVIYMFDRSSQTFYSIISEDKKSHDKSKNGMIRRLLNTKFKGKYNTALIYDNVSGQLINKFVRGIKEL